MTSAELVSDPVVFLATNPTLADYNGSVKPYLKFHRTKNVNDTFFIRGDTGSGTAFNTIKFKVSICGNELMTLVVDKPYIADWKISGDELLQTGEKFFKNDDKEKCPTKDYTLWMDKDGLIPLDKEYAKTFVVVDASIGLIKMTGGAMKKYTLFIKATSIGGVTAVREM